jgi:hypothetical protein
MRLACLSFGKTWSLSINPGIFAGWLADDNFNEGISLAQNSTSDEC